MPRIKLSKSKDQLSILNPDERSCMYCEKEIKEGRSDKKFCDNICRNNYNNVLKSAANNLIRNVNNALVKNRRILETMLSSGKAKATRQTLVRAGFQFEYHTNTRINKNGGTYYYCYDYGYLSLAKNLYLIVRQKQ